MKTKQLAAIIATLPVFENSFTIHQELNSAQLEEDFRVLIKNRMEHCQEMFLLNIDDAHSTSSGQIAFSDNWHFSLPVYQALEDALSQPMDQWSKLVWQQIIREQFLHNSRNIDAFMYATEKLLVL